MSAATMAGADMKTLLVALACWVATAASASQGWQCRNTDVEVTCDAGRCHAATTFTPLDVSLDASGTLSVCAYSGCWAGASQRQRVGEHQVVVTSQLPWQGVGDGREDFLLVIDPRDRVGWLKGAGFATPVNCRPHTPQPN